MAEVGRDSLDPGKTTAILLAPTVALLVLALALVEAV